ncbi:hypothetical protein K491DRAFT_86263 [Lophiostoma macrostomum CBS 122681]|uniref:Uncharacterized protein n=1 Tax=Lophiostoma macrostomum CBS 122681 TaxID=1314788 RepID=A0A6A6SXA8_9PLEO|nr:hypothetical protein K491DRAFT_86263 [Lophiostoma macrostomum CBS 122681]
MWVSHILISKDHLRLRSLGPQDPLLPSHPPQSTAAYSMVEDQLRAGRPCTQHWVRSHNPLMSGVERPNAASRFVCTDALKCSTGTFD